MASDDRTGKFAKGTDQMSMNTDRYRWETNHLPNGQWEVIDVKEVIGQYRTYSTVVRGITKEQCEKIVMLHNAARAVRP